MIDIIIPCYGTQNYLYKCLSSVVIQSALDRCKITCVVDGEDQEPYKVVAEKFKPYMDIQVIGYEDNRGPGPCRNYGIDNTSYPHVMFLDSDDVLNGVYAVQFLRKNIEGHDICYGKFILEEKDSVKVLNEWNCLHGKMYKRDFLDKYNIRMGNFRPHEDLSFNHVCGRLPHTQNAIEEVLYVRKYRETSTMGQLSTKNDEVEYIKSIRWASLEVEKRGFPLDIKERLDAFMSVCIITLRGKTPTPDTVAMIKEFYRDIVAPFEYTWADVEDVYEHRVPHHLMTLEQIENILDVVKGK